MIVVDKLPERIQQLVSIDPGASGGWAMFVKHESVWLLRSCGLARPDLGERPYRLTHIDSCCAVEVPQHQKKDTPKRTNDLFKTTLRAGLLAEATNADCLLIRHPHDWKGSVDKTVHNNRCLERLAKIEIDVLKYTKRGDGKPVPEKQLNNVIDAIGLGLTVLDRWS